MPTETATVPEIDPDDLPYSGDADNSTMGVPKGTCWECGAGPYRDCDHREEHWYDDRDRELHPLNEYEAAS